MKHVLFVCNTMGQAGAEMAMMAMMAAMHRDGWKIDLLPIIPQGEMYGLLPEYVHILGKTGSSESVHSEKGRKKLTFYSSGALAKKGWGRIPYLWKNLCLQRKNGSVKIPILLWRILADAAPEISEKYDLAVAYLEGAATYYVADYVKAALKVSFVHIDITKAGYITQLDRPCYEKIDHIFTVSHAAKQEFLKHYPEFSQKVSVFQNMVDKDRILRLSQKDAGFSDHFSGVRLLSVGRLMKQKTYDIGIKACAVMKQRGLNVRWYVIGTGDLKEELLHLCRQLGVEHDFVFLGAMTNPYPYVRSCDIFMQTSGWEGRSIALFEAQVLCRPIIVSDCAGNLEQITNGVNGMVTGLNPEAIADTVEDLVKHPEKRDALHQYLTDHDVLQENDLHLLYRLLPEEV